MNRRTKTMIGTAAAAVVLGVAATGVATAAGTLGDDGPDVPISGADLDRATEAALAETGGGDVVETEVEDDGTGYEVEVDLGDGRRMEIQLDKSFAVVGSESDDEGDDGDAD
jgi:uncharacterized membrane protein YkoI